jgi:hypothetical protein
MSKKIKVKYSYRDLVLNRFVIEGEELIVSDERAELLLKKGFVRNFEDVVEEVVQDIVQEVVQKEEKLEAKTKELKISKKTK